MLRFVRVEDSAYVNNVANDIKIVVIDYLVVGGDDEIVVVVDEIIAVVDVAIHLIV